MFRTITIVIDLLMSIQQGPPQLGVSMFFVLVSKHCFSAKISFTVKDSWTPYLLFSFFFHACSNIKKLRNVLFYTERLSLRVLVLNDLMKCFQLILGKKKLFLLFSICDTLEGRSKHL